MFTPSPVVFQQIVDTFREKGWADATYADVGRILGIDQTYISQAWRTGFKPRKSVPNGYPPVKTIALEEMRTGVRYRAPGLEGDVPLSPFLGGPNPPPAPAPAALVPAEPVQATVVPKTITQEDIVEHAKGALASELKAIAVVRDLAVGAAHSARKMLGALQGRIDQMAQELAEQDARGTPVDHKELAKTLRSLLVVAEKASKVTKEAIESERLAVGAPTEIIKITSTTTQNTDAAAEAAARSQKVLDFLAGRKKNELPADTGSIGEASMSEESSGEDQAVIDVTPDEGVDEPDDKDDEDETEDADDEDEGDDATDSDEDTVE